MRIIVLIDSGSIDDLGYLVVLVVVVKKSAIQSQRAIEQCVFRAQLKSVDELGLKGQGVSGLYVWMEHVMGRKDRSGRIGATGLIAMGVGAIDQCLVCESELWSPICNSATSELVPLLIDDAHYRITPTGTNEPTGNVGKMLLIFRPPQASDQFKIAEYVVIHFAKCCI